MTVLVLNMGLKSVRSIIFRENGIKVADVSCALTSSISDNRVEQFPDEWWEKAVDVMRTSIHDAMIERIDYITVTASASCLVCMDKEEKVLMDAIMVSDKRAVDESNDIKKIGEYKAVSEQVGLEVTPGLMLPKILWVKNHKKDVFDKTDYFLSPNDFLIFHLTGEVVTDELNATKYHYSTENQMYPTALLSVLGIPESKLPRVWNTGNVVGTIRKRVAKEIGCNETAKVVLSSYDAMCSFIGSGVSEEGEASDVSGTVTVFRLLSRNQPTDFSRKIYTVPFRQGDFHIIGGSNNMGGGLIEWVKQCYYTKEEYPYEVMEKEAAESKIGARGIIFLPYLLGERAPLWNDNARGVFFGLERMHTRKDMTRAVFESAAFVDRLMMDAIAEKGSEIQSIRLSGGLARLNLISQIKADVTGKTVMVLSEFETTASGAAMIVLNAREGISFTELSGRFSRVRTTIHPDMRNHEIYDVMYELFRETYTTLEPLFNRRTELLRSIRSASETQIENL